VEMADMNYPEVFKTNPEQFDYENVNLELMYMNTLFFRFKNISQDGSQDIDVSINGNRHKGSYIEYDKVRIPEVMVPLFVAVSKEVWSLRVSQAAVSHDDLIEVLYAYKSFVNHLQEFGVVDLSIFDDGSPLKSATDVGMVTVTDYLTDRLKVSFSIPTNFDDTDGSASGSIAIYDSTATNDDGSYKYEVTRTEYEIPHDSVVRFIQDWRSVHTPMFYSWMERKKEVQKALESSIHDEASQAAEIMASKGYLMVGSGS
jgi:hypothetical protein